MVADFISHVDSGRHHLALDQIRKFPGLLKFKDVKKAIVTADVSYRDRWPHPSEVSDNLRREYRSFAKLYNEVLYKLGIERELGKITEYPDGQKIIFSVSNLPGSKPILAHSKENLYDSLNGQCSAVVICFEGKSAKMAAIQVQQRLEYFIKQDRPAKVGTWLKELGLSLKFVRVHDCQEHPLK